MHADITRKEGAAGFQYRVSTNVYSRPLRQLSTRNTNVKARITSLIPNSHFIIICQSVASSSAAIHDNRRAIGKDSHDTRSTIRPKLAYSLNVSLNYTYKYVEQLYQQS